MKTTHSLALFLALALVLLGLFLLGLSPSTARAANPIIIRVKTTGTTVWPCGNQTNWSNACALQAALTNASSGTELWVAAGTYTPTVGTDRTATFGLRDGIALYGGFAGTETARSQRSIQTYHTILSGDIGTPGNIGDNVYHVVTVGSGVTAAAILDGLSVIGGNANGASYPSDRGGGMFIDEASPTLTNVTFNADAAVSGGAIYNLGGSPTLTGVRFFNGVASSFGGAMYNAGGNPTLTSVEFEWNQAPSGGAIFNNGGSPTLTDALFISNDASHGGGMYNLGGSPTVRNAFFLGNTGSAYGGGIYNSGSNSKLTSVTFVGNSAAEGGALANFNSSPALTNTTFLDNTATGAAGMGGGIYSELSSATLNNVTLSGNSATSTGGGIVSLFSSMVTIRNTILWGNTAPTNPQIYNDGSSSATIYDSVVQGGYAGGTHIVTADPRFGPQGYWFGSAWVIPLLRGSSAVDAGDDLTCATTDQRGVARPAGLHCDIGAYEGILDQARLPLIRK